jgi:hypothetical protein
MTLNPADSYHRHFKAFLDAISPELAADLSAVTALPAAQADRVVAEILSCACQATHASLIELGREAAASLPRQWLMEQIERVADRTLNYDDEWEYRRLLELYKHLDDALLSRLVHRGINSKNSEIAEAAGDFSPRPGL